MAIDFRTKERGAREARRGGARPRITAADIRHAIGFDQFFVVYQPQIDVLSGGIRGVEALVRWNHPLLGSLSPADFLPVAERSGDIVALDQFVLERACADLARWRDEGYPDLRIAVNLSTRSLEDPGLLGRIAAIRARFAVSAHQLEVEVTESAAIRDSDVVEGVLTKLRESGVLVALDDFGTGYSMLDRLRALPFDALKIDRSFVAGMTTSSGPQLLLAAIALGHGLGLRVVAEGVEDEAQLHFLAKHRCDEVQGYLLGRPMPYAQVLAQLRVPRPLPSHRDGGVPEPFGTGSAALERLVRPLLTELARLTELESTYLTVIDRDAGEQVILFARNASELQIGEGLHVPWQDTVCKRSLELGVRCTSDVQATFPDSSAAAELGLQTYAGVPVMSDVGEVWGTLCGASIHARSVGEPTLTVMEAFARLIASQLDLTEWRVPGGR